MTNKIMRRKKITGKVVIFTIVIFALLSFVVWVFGKIESRKIIIEDENLLIRTINTYDFSEEPTNRKIPWESELPKFVTDDIELLKRDMDIEEIQYSYQDSIIKIYMSEYENKIVLDIIEDEEIQAIFQDFSIYNYKENKSLIIYGYSSGRFYSYIIGNIDVGTQYLSPDKNLPLYEKTKSSTYTPSNMECIICFDENGDISTYSKGEKISSEYNVGEIKRNLGNGLFLTTNNKLYYAYINDESELKVEFLNTIDEMDEWYYNYVEISNKNEIRLYIFKKDGKDYVAYPNDWNTYLAYNEQSYPIPEKLDFSWSFEKLEDLSKYAIITYDYSSKYMEFRWIAQVVLDINGKECEYVYDIDGYDNQAVDLSLEDEMPIKVTTEEEYWNAVKEIRQRYEKYYSNPK